MKKTGILLICTALAMLVSIQSAWAATPGSAEIRFNRKFVPSIKPSMTYEQVVKLVGVEGVKVAEDRSSSPPVVSYGWNGGKKSSLTVRMKGNRLIGATINAPNRKTYVIKNSGEVVVNP